MARKDANILAIIPARAGSRGIPNKNIRMFAGKPLIAYTIEVAKAAPSLDRIVVSTDSQEIAGIAQKYGAEVPFLRPAELATDASTVVDAVIHLLEQLRKDGYEPTHILLLQPTSPLRTSEDIESAVRLFNDSRADSLVSVCRSENVLMTKDKGNVIHFENPEMLTSPNRQQLPAYFRFDGSMLYLVDAKKLIAEKTFFPGKLVGYEIPRWRAIDLDEPEDFVVGEVIFGNRKEVEKRIRGFS
ncbi:acylneuraminate cytidylyltransferase family protein [Candidatus Kaiserbacteria bacterium]|nr:acylneuraminate cytidylyltransferase family protein [Candidatus Kaiserbacteria bacterium]